MTSITKNVENIVYIHNIISDKGARKSSKIIITTECALYVCRENKISSSVEILDTYPWIDFIRFEEVSSDRFKYFFNIKNSEKEVLVGNKNRDDVYNEISSIKSIYNLENISTPSNSNTNENEEVNMNLLYIFLSSCLSKNKRPNQKIVESIIRSIKKNKPINMIFQENYDKDMIDIYRRTFETACVVQKLIIGGKYFKNLYKWLSSALDSFKVSKLIIKQSSNESYFDEFLSKLVSNFDIKSLKFLDVNFTDQMWKSITEIGFSSSLESVTFDKFVITPDIFSSLINSSDSKKFPCRVKFNNCSQILSKFDGLFGFVTLNRIRILVMKNMDLNIAPIIRELGNDMSTVVYLDLSGNCCVSEIESDIRFPAGLEKLVLKNVTWSESALESFLSGQIFSSSVSLDISDCINSTGSSNVFNFESLKGLKTQDYKVSKLVFRNNYIPINLLRFIAQYPYLSTINFEGCRIFDKDDSEEEKKIKIGSLISIISNSSIQRLNLSGVLSEYEFGGLEEIKDSLISSKCLSSLDFSDNSIGNEGLQKMYEIIEKSPKLCSVRLGGSNISDPFIFLDFLKDVLSLKRPVKLHIPSKELKNIRKIEPTLKDSIALEWAKIANSNKDRYDSYQSDFDVSTNSCLFSEKFESSNAEENSRQIIETTWDVEEYSRAMYDFQTQWNNLKMMYSFENITGEVKPECF